MSPADGARAALWACLLALLAGCGGGETPPPPAQPYADPGFVEAAGCRLHYALTPTIDLPSGVAGSYGIVQRRNLALLTVALVMQDGAACDVALRSATAVSLTGLRRPLALARHDDDGAPTFLATVEIRDREAVTIEILALAAGREIEARFTRSFHVD